MPRDEMSRLWGPQRKFSTWRRLWVALAEAEAELGLPITQAQIDELKRHVDQIDFAAAEAYERKLRHDVMAHVHAYGDVCPAARGIIHLGATSCYVTDNTDLLLIREGLELVQTRLVRVIDRLAALCPPAAGPGLPGVHAFSAGAAHDGRQAGLLVDLRPGAGPGGGRVPPGAAQGPRRERDDRHAGQLPGAVRRRSCQGAAAG